MTVRDIIMSSAGGASAPANYIEGAFSTYLYTGNGSTQTINNGIDESGKGAMTWIKSRSGAINNFLFDTTRGAGNFLSSNTTSAENNVGSAFLSSFNSNGFSLGSGGSVNGSGTTFASWTFRKQPKFFDVVTWTGTSSGSSTRAIPHNLGSTPGFIVVKVLNSTSDWPCYHRSTGGSTIRLNGTSAANNVGDWGTVDSSVFTVTNAGNGLNFLGLTYVAYLFAHDAGGFGESGEDNVVSCGSFTGTGEVNLGYEPQWLLIKRADDVSDWRLYDSMRGWTSSGDVALLRPNLSNVEAAVGGPSINATGFTSSAGTATYIYIAIRRGPMKVPTDGTKVFAPVAQNTSANSVVTTNFPVDLSISTQRSKVENGSTHFFDRLRGTSTTGGAQLRTNASSAELVQTTNAMGLANNTALIDNYYTLYGVTGGFVYWNFRRAPGFFDVVCYTGDSVQNRQVPHNLTVKPEFVIYKSRSNVKDWYVYNSAFTATNYMRLNTGFPTSAATFPFNNVEPTNTYLSLNNDDVVNQAGWTYVAYLFATCPGVSKIGSYTGNGTTQTIPCGFAAGARFVMIKRADGVDATTPVGDWYVWDSARGIVAGNDPHLSLNSTTAEVTSNDSVDPVSTGFIVNQVAATNINVSGGSYIFLAIA